ncbi:MAG: glycosyltransferase family 4 protein [Terriglobia bacterium]
MTTLQVDLGPQWRGGQNQALLLLRGLRARGYRAELVAVGSAPLAQHARAEGFPVHAVGRRITRLQAVLRLRQLLARERFELLHLHEAHGLTAAWLARAHRHSGVVASRRVAYPLHSNPLALARYRALHRVLAVSRFVAERVVASGLPKEQVEIVYDGVEFPPWPAPDARRQARRRWAVGDNNPVLGAVGYLLPDKGQESLIRAFPAVRAQFPACQLLLAGDGPCRRRLERLGRALGVHAGVHFTGFVEDVAPVYHALDLFLFPAREEGLGTALLTAMAYALPVVAIDRGAAREVVTHEQTGLLVPDSHPASIAAAVLGLLRDPAWAHQLGAAARNTIQQHFTADQMVENTLRVYQTVASSERHP